MRWFLYVTSVQGHQPADSQTWERRRGNARCLTCEDCWELEADRTVKDGIWAPNVCFFEGGLVQIPKRGGGRVERRLRRDAIAERLFWVCWASAICVHCAQRIAKDELHPSLSGWCYANSVNPLYLIVKSTLCPSWTWRCVWGVIWLCFCKRENIYAKPIWKI